MKKIIFCFALLTVLLVAACTKYRDVAVKYPAPPPPPAGIITYGCLRINEFMLKGAAASSEDTLGGSTAKWFEIYNPTTADITLTAGQWFVTDDNGTPTKYAIPLDTVHGANTNWVVKANGFIVIACPKSGSTTISPNHINASFSLNSDSGSIGIFYHPTLTSTITIAIDTLNYNYGSAGASTGVTYGRYQDGKNLNLATPLTKITCNYSNN